MLQTFAEYAIFPSTHGPGIKFNRVTKVLAYFKGLVSCKSCSLTTIQNSIYLIIKKTLQDTQDLKRNYNGN